MGRMTSFQSTGKIIGCLVLALILLSGGFYLGRRTQNLVISPDGHVTEKEKPYTAYTFDALAARPSHSSKIEIGRSLGETDSYTSYVFYYTGDGKRISGFMNVPKSAGVHPVVVMARGYVDKEKYVTGMGTKNAAAYYATHGYLTLAPDFSGYGESDPEDTTALGARVRKPVEILDLLASIPTLPYADIHTIYLWGHSNGGQIMLSVAEIVGRMGEILSPLQIKGVTLWAPVSKPFPYNILYFTDEADDKGKWLRHELAQFESEYDVFQYSLDQHWDWIRLPIQLHQGTADQEVPWRWSSDLVKSLKSVGIDITFFTYPGADHNLNPGWNTVVMRDVDYFHKLAQ
jgi:dienelactone hydrolase